MTDSIKQHILGSEAVILESNHDVDMLLYGSYPYSLKQRILSERGHLSNDDCAQNSGGTAAKRYAPYPAGPFKQ